jgi:hypothetical protein
VDLANNIEQLAEDRESILNKLLVKASQVPSQKLRNNVIKYGNTQTKKMFEPLFKADKIADHA